MLLEGIQNLMSKEEETHANWHHIIQREPASSDKKGVLVGLGHI